MSENVQGLKEAAREDAKVDDYYNHLAFEYGTAIGDDDALWDKVLEKQCQNLNDRTNKNFIIFLYNNQ